MLKRRIATGVAAVALLVPLSGCGLFGGGGGGDDSTSGPQTSGAPSSGGGKGGDALPKAAAYRVIQAGAEGENGEDWVPYNIVVAFYGVYRDGEYSRLLMGAWLQSGTDQPLSDDFQAEISEYLQFSKSLESSDVTSTSAFGVGLVDAKERKAYLVARDAAEGGYCFCPSNIEVTPALTTLFSATYAAPPAGTKSMGVTSNLGYVPGVPVIEGKAPSPNGSYTPPGRDLPTVYHETPPATADAPMKAEVVDIDAPVSNLDLSVTEKKDRLSLAADVLFEFDKATLNAKGKARVAEAAEILKKKARGKAQVNGYTDAKGSDSYNLSLSKRRAEAVTKALEAKLSGTGITLTAKGYGEAQPVAPNTIDSKDNPRGRALNRRVEVVYAK